MCEGSISVTGLSSDNVNHDQFQHNPVFTINKDAINIEPSYDAHTWLTVSEPRTAVFN